MHVRFYLYDILEGKEDLFACVKKKKNGRIPKTLVTRMRMRIRMYGDESGSKDFQ